MSERILPGVAIREVTEGLIGVPSPGLVAVKLVGTACKGPLTPQYFGPGEVAKFREMYGPADPYHYSTSTTTNPPMELTLRRAGDLMFSAAPPGGIHVQRVADSDVDYAVGNEITYETAGNLVFTAAQPGAWFNNINFRLFKDKNVQGSTETGTSLFELEMPSLDYFDSAIGLTNTSPRISENRFAGSVYTFEFFDASGVTASPADFVSQWTSTGNALLSNLLVVTSTGTGTLFDSGAYNTDATWYSLLGTSDTGGSNWSGGTQPDQAVTGTAAISAGLELLRSQEARLTVIAGASENTNFPTGTIALGLGHVNNASMEGREQLYICGVDNYASQDTMVTNITTATALNLADARVVKVAPGIISGNPYQSKGSVWQFSEIFTDGEVAVSGGYAAALVAGVIAQNAPDQSSMNKPISVGGLEFDFTLSNKKTLTRDNFFLLVNDAGYRTLRDISCAGDGDAFFHISTRMALDDVKRSVRLAGYPFLGKKNVPRILSQLKTNLEYVLKRYVRREIITPTWSLDVSSSRTEQILGVVTIVMVIQLVFYIEFIEVTIVLE